MESSTSFALDNFLKKARLCYDNLKFGKAYAFYLLVLKVSPAIRHNIKEEFTETWREWSEKLLHLNKIQELVTLYEQGSELYPDCDVFHVTMGTCYVKIGHKLAAFNTFKRALLANPKNIFAKECVDNVCREIIDNWHYPMINDLKRNTCFRDSIHEYVAGRARSGLRTEALDIGSGTGIMSMFAAQSGVDHVYACEMSSTMSSIAEEIIKSNGFSNTITNWKCYSTDITVSDDISDSEFTLPSRIPLVITETLDAGALGEGIVKVVDHAWKQLLTEDGTVIPSRVKIMCLLVESEEIYEKHSCICDVMPGILLTSNVGIQNPFTTAEDQVLQDCVFEPYTSERLTVLDHRVLSESKPITSVDFNDRAQIENLVEDSSEIQVEIPIDKDGYLDAAILYFELAVDKSAKHVISSEISSDHCWEQAVYPLRDLRIVADSCLRNPTSKLGSSPLSRIAVRHGDNVALRFIQESDKLSLVHCSVRSEKLSAVEYPQFIPMIDKSMLHVVLKVEEIELLNDKKYWNFECNNFIAKLQQCSNLTRNLSNENIMFEKSDSKQNGHKSTVTDNGVGHCNSESGNEGMEQENVTVLILLEEFSALPFNLAQLFPGSQIHICVKNYKLKKIMKEFVLFLGVHNITCSSQPDASIKYNAVFADVVERGGMMRPMVLESIAEARMCLKPYGIVFPNLIRVMALPIESEEFCQSCMVMNERNTLGLKIKNHMDCFQITTRSHFAMHKMKYEALSEPQEIFAFHMNDKESFPSFLNSEKNSHFLMTRTGKIHCVLLWFKIEMYEGHNYNTSDPTNSFLQSAVLTKKNDLATTVNAGETIILNTQCYRSYIAIELSGSTRMDCS